MRFKSYKVVWPFLLHVVSVKSRVGHLSLSMTICTWKLECLPYLKSLCLPASVQMVSAGTNKLRLHLLFFCTNLNNSSKMVCQRLN